MDYESALKKFKEWQFRLSAYSMALHIIEIDQMTVAPIGGSAYRDERNAFLSGELHSIETDPSMIEVLDVLRNEQKSDYAIRRQAELYYEEVVKQNCIPKKVYVEFVKLKGESYTAWLEAKKKNNYSIFEPYLKKMIETKKLLYAYRRKEESIYDQMLNDFEPGMNQEKYDAFFAAVNQRLLPLIQAVSKADPIDESFLYQYYDPKLQKQYTEEHLLKYLRFDRSWGYQNETEHPFTDWICENDCRTTTKYLDRNIVSSIFSTVHEVGHATYEHQCDPVCDGNILSEGISSGMHESQSRLCENYLARRISFWQANYPPLQKMFPNQLGSIPLEDFVKAVNVSKCSLVRTEADELTYPIHIFIRYRIEKGLFDGTISTENLNQTWNAMYEKYLGVKVTDDRDGILQDVHWADGEFGYFPTYALGSAYAAQFMEAMEKDIDVDRALANEHYDIPMNWLKEHIHQYGFLYDPEVVIEKATGKPFDVSVYLDYLEDKYTQLYHL